MQNQGEYFQKGKWQTLKGNFPDGSIKRRWRHWIWDHHPAFSEWSQWQHQTIPLSGKANPRPTNPIYEGNTMVVFNFLSASGWVQRSHDRVVSWEFWTVSITHPEQGMYSFFWFSAAILQIELQYSGKFEGFFRISIHLLAQ